MARFARREASVEPDKQPDIGVLIAYTASVEDYGDAGRNLACAWDGIQSESLKNEVICNYEAVSKYGYYIPCMALHYDENRVELIGAVMTAIVNF